MIKIAHIINTFIPKEGSEMEVVMPLTIRSMEEAAQMAGSGVKVELFSAQFSTDRKAIPYGWHKTPDLERSTYDIPEIPKQRKLPFIGDIIQRLYDSTDAEYLIYTNADIILKPDFYAEVAQMIESGNDAIIMNRRRIPYKPYKIRQLPEIFEQKSKSHPGFDCFIFHRDLQPYFVTSNICVGISFIGVSMAHNLFAHAKNLLFLDNAYLTYHVGMDVMVKHQKDYYWHNRNQFFKIVKPALWDKWDTRKFPYGDLPFLIRHIKWGLNPSLFIYMNFKLEMKRWFGWFKNG